MILCIDAGNTNIKYGIFQKNKLLASFRVATDYKKTCDEYGVTLINMLMCKNIKVTDLQGVIISSVVPSLNYTILHMCKSYLHLDAILVGAGTKTGHNIRTDSPKEVGSDRIVNNVAAIAKYGVPLIVIDFGTATTFNVINSKKEFIGGVISAGVRGALDSLVNGTAKLPKVELEMPKSAIAKNTITNMQAGILLGTAGAVQYIVKKIKAELDEENVKVVATGGFSNLIAHEVQCIEYIDRQLTLNGLNILYHLNTKKEEKSS